VLFVKDRFTSRRLGSRMNLPFVRQGKQAKKAAAIPSSKAAQLTAFH
jgi:hypothetical protein